MYAKCWAPQTEVEQVILILHDISDHIGRFDDLSTFLIDHNIAVLGFDQHGHGKSNGKRGHIKNYDLILSNIQEIAIEARKRYNDQPLFLYGQGMGGNIAINYILRQTNREFSGVILSSPWLEPAMKLSGFKKTFFRIISVLNPSYAISTGIDPMELSHDPETGLNYLEDQLIHGLISIKLYNDLSKGASWAIDKMHVLKYPMLLMHGEEDRICPVRATKHLAERANGIAELKVWEGMRHEPHHEKNKKEVFRFILDWINKKETG